MRHKVYIVARSTREANRYAADQGFHRGEFQTISHVSQLRAARYGEIHLIPGWEQAPNRHALKAALRYARVEVFEVAPAEVSEQTETALDPGLEAAIQSVSSPSLDPRDDLTERDLEVAYRYNRLRNIAEDQAAMAINPEPSNVTLRPFTEAEVAALDDSVESERESTGTTEPSEDPAPTEESVSRRRSRCKQCGILHYKGDPCPTDEAGA